MGSLDGDSKNEPQTHTANPAGESKETYGHSKQTKSKVSQGGRRRRGQTDPFLPRSTSKPLLGGDAVTRFHEAPSRGAKPRACTRAAQRGKTPEDDCNPNHPSFPERGAEGTTGRRVSPDGGTSHAQPRSEAGRWGRLTWKPRPGGGVCIAGGKWAEGSSGQKPHH